MPAPTRKMQSAEKHIETALPLLPFYVTEYVRAKKRLRRSPATLSGYLHDYKRFFDWLRKEGFTAAKANKDIPYSVLEHLKKKDVEFFFEMLTEVKIEKSKDVFTDRKTASVARFTQSLKSLFNYLTTESEDDETGECYLERNVMAKIKTPKDEESVASRAKRINKQILKPEKMDGLISFIENDYCKELSPRQLSRFERDKTRDVAIISLFIGSGIRVNELTGLLITDIDFLNGDVNALRKGSKTDTVSVQPSSMFLLEKYLVTRESTYKPEPKNKYLFLTRYGGNANPISVEMVQKIVQKYTRAYLKGKELSPHKLRHSFSKRYLDEGGTLVGLRDQLGHNNIETTVRYTNYSQQEQRDVLKRMDKKHDENTKP